MKRKDVGEIISVIGQIVAYIIGVILLVQIIKALFGGTWEIEDIILALVIFNLTISFGIGSYLISLNNKIASVDSKIEGHFSWHKGKDEKRK